MENLEEGMISFKGGSVTYLNRNGFDLIDDIQY
jgi:hypothetical protein